MPIFEVTSPSQAVDVITEILKRTKDTNPLTPVQFITDNYRQGGQLVNQYVAAYLGKTAKTSIVGVSQITQIDLLESICDILDIEWSRHKYEAVLAKNVNAKLYGGMSFLNADTLIPSTVSQIQNLILGYQWVDFDDEQLVAAVQNSTATATSKKLFELAMSVDKELAESGVLSPARISRICSEEKYLSRLQEMLSGNHFVVLSQSCPKTLLNLFQTVISDDRLSQIRGNQNVPKPTSLAEKLELVSFPDVLTEVRAGVSKVIEFLVTSGKPEDVAILYSDELDYAKHLTIALDDAGITWQGVDPDSLSTTKLAWLSLELLSIATGLGSRKLDRKFILRLIRSGLLRRQADFGENFSWMNVERFIRARGLFNQAENWLPQLTTISGGVVNLENELEQLEHEAEDNEDLIKSTKQKLNDARAAKALGNLILSINSFIDGLEQAKGSLSEHAVMISVLGLLTDLVGDPKKRKIADSEKACFEAIDLFTQQLVGESELVNNSVIPSVLSKIGNLLNSGNNFRKGPGVFVGELTQHPLRHIRFQVLLGMSEGAFPRRRQEDPLCPDSIREALGDEYLNLLPTASMLTENEIYNVLTFIGAAESAYLSYSRGGLIGQGSGNLSAVLEPYGKNSNFVSSFEDFVDYAPNSVLASDISRKVNLSNMTGGDIDRKRYPGLDSMVALASNEYGSFSGNLEPGLETFNFDNHLSASAIETYLKCPHKFFVTKVLGFKFEDDDDEVETLRALDYGSMVHKSLELFHHYCVDNQLMPNFGEPYSTQAVEVFKSIFNNQCDEVIQRGQAGWMPLFEQKRRNFLKLTDLYFELEHEFRSTAPREKSTSRKVPLRPDLTLRPHLVEFSFDSHGIMPLEISITSSNQTVRRLFFKGLMDRVDKSAPDVHAGVVDFKTGRADRLVDSRSELIQHLLYSYALRKNAVDFANVLFVSFAYITLNSPKQSRVVRFGDPDKRIYLDEHNGGYSQTEMVSRMKMTNQNQDAKLIEILTGFVDANEQGQFPPFAESRTVSYCEVCKESFGTVRAEAIYKKASNKIKDLK